MKIVFLDTETIGEVSNLDKLDEFGEVTYYPVTKPDERISRISGNEVVITNKVVIDKKVIDASPMLKLVCIAATGMNNVDLDYAAGKGIQVKNVAGYSTESVAQSTFTLLFYLLNKPRYFDEYVKSGKYIQSPVFTHIGRTFWQLSGKKFGIIGLGTIGKRVAQIATAFGAEVIYHSTSGKNLEQSYPHYKLDELLGASDVISVHCPLNDKTRNLITYRELSLMKPSSILLNTGRGGIINEKDLAKALDENVIMGAGFDVLTHEPVLADNPLLKIRDPEKLIITPHVAWTSIEAREKLVEGIYQNIKRFINYTNGL
jgi:lactate dehydrogenase-like 2-hydroxyacid dehydrogenase